MQKIAVNSKGSNNRIELNS